MGPAPLESTDGLSQWIKIVAAVALTATTVDDALSSTVKLVCEQTGWPIGHILKVSDDGLELVSTDIWYDIDPVARAPFVAASAAARFGRGTGLPGSILESGEPLWVPDMRLERDFPRYQAAEQCGIGAIMGFPIIGVRGIEGVMEFLALGPMEPDPATLDLISHIGLHLGGVIDRARVREDLESSESRLRTLVESAPDALLVVDYAGTIALANEEAERLSGYTRNELLGRAVEDLVPDAVRQAHHAHRDGYAAHPRRRTMGAGRDLTVRRKDGTEVPVDISLSPIDLSGTGQVVVSIRDMSERRRADEAVRLSEARLAEAQRVAHIGTWSWDVGSDYVLWSAELKRIYGMDGEDGPISFPEYAMLVHPEDRDRVTSVVIQTVRNLRPFEHEYRIVLPSGEMRWLHARGDVAEERDGKALRLGGYCHDITDRKLAEARRNRALEDLYDYQQILERVARDEPLADSLEALCLEVEKRLAGAMCTILLVDERDRTLRHVASPSLPGAFSAAIDGLPVARGLGSCGTAAATGEIVVVEDAFQDPLTAAFVDLGREFDLRSVWSFPLKGASGNVLGSFAIYRRTPHRPDEDEIGVVKVAGDLAALAIERNQADTALALAAQVDPLTGLPNRARFLEELKRRLDEDVENVVVMFIDLDRFKWINDSLGHPAGDRILVDAANRLRETVTGSSFVARFGGDEFTILLSNPTPTRIVEVAESVERAFEEPFLLDGGEFFLSVSIGIASDDPRTGPSEMIRDADAAMYAAKEQGRARHVWFDERLRERAVERVSLESKIRRGIERDEFVMHYQPVADLRTGRWSGVEALARWNHPDLGLVGPDQFIPLAEETGLILPLGEALLEKALSDAHLIGPDTSLAVNISPVQLSDPALAAGMRSLIDRFGISPRRIVLELTESSLMGDFETARSVLDELAVTGFHLVIDDFGTGYSSIARLTELPVQGIKLDRSFIVRLGSDPAVEQVIAAIIDLTHALELQVVGEGVETEYAVNLLRRLGCDYAQGYHLARPLPVDQLAPLLEAGPPSGPIS